MTLIEACVTTVAQARRAQEAGAGRVELCRELEAGGLTPGDLLTGKVCTAARVPVLAMVRPAATEFCTSPGEVAVMIQQIAALRDLGVAGVVLGLLDRSGRIDANALDELTAAAGALPVTFHRAFDRLADPLAGLELLAAAGVARVLTSGGPAAAWDGRGTLRDLVAASAGRVAVIAGGSVRGDHVRQLVQFTGVAELHARATAIPAIAQALAVKNG